jgi:hypothetical protein
MKKLITILLVLLSVMTIRGQGDVCATATVLPINTTCSNSASNIVGANTASGETPLPFCGANWKDIWYKFTGTGNMVVIKYTPVPGRDALIAVYTGSCGSLTQIDCGDLNGNNTPEVSIIENTSTSLTYYVRVMRFGSGNMNGQICAWGGVETFGNSCFTPPSIGISNPILYSSTLSTPVGQAAYDPSTTQFTCNGSIDNLTYFKVITNSAGGTITLNVDEVSCWVNTGIQIGLFLPTTPCSSPTDWNNTVFCNLISANTTTIVNWTGLLPNTTYYMIIDGYGGDLCGWRITFSGVLPIDLVSFTGETYNDYNILKWITASEVNNDYFTIERSHNAIDFEKVDIVNGGGNSNIVLTYTLVDTKPYKTVTYYRLIQTDYDGKHETSNIISVSRPNNGDVLELIKIVNILGQEVTENSEGVKIYFFNNGTVIKKYIPK